MSCDKRSTRNPRQKESDGVLFEECLLGDQNGRIKSGKTEYLCLWGRQTGSQGSYTPGHNSMSSLPQRTGKSSTVADPKYPRFVMLLNWLLKDQMSIRASTRQGGGTGTATCLARSKLLDDLSHISQLYCQGTSGIFESDINLTFALSYVTSFCWWEIYENCSSRIRLAV